MDTSSFTEETLSLYLRFHLRLGKGHLAAALPLLDAECPKRLAEKSLGIQFLLREAWELNGEIFRILDDCRSRIAQGDRNWAVISLYIDKLAEEALKTTPNGFHDQDLAVLVDAAEKDKWADRGSFLGVLEAFRLARKSQLPTQYLTKRGLDYLKLLTRYYNHFSNRLSCFDDIRPYLGELEDGDRETFFSTISQKQPVLTSEDGVIRCVNAEKIQYLMRPEVDVSTASSRMLNEYTASLNHARLPDTEMQFGDDLVLLTILSNLSFNDPNTLARCAAMANFGLTESKRAYRLRLLLIRLLLQLGSLRLAMDHYTALGLKAVQLDTASHYGLDRNTAFGGSLATFYDNHWSNTHKRFYLQSQVEVPEAIGQAFTNNKFSQVAQLSEFHHRITTSCSSALMELDLIRSKIIEQKLTYGERDQAIKVVCQIMTLTKEGTFSDQRDISLIPFYRESSKNEIEKSISNGPLRQGEWINAILEVVTLVLGLDPPASVDTTQLTDAELALVSLARNLRGATCEEKIKLTAKIFFESELTNKLTTELQTLLEGNNNSFSVLHAAWIGIEVRITNYLLRDCA